MQLETAQPEEVGLSTPSLVKARQYAQQVGDQLGSTGGAVLIIRHDRIAGEWYWGRRGPGAGDKPFDRDTLVPLLSVTKGFTAIALALLIQDGLLWLDEPIYRHLPELGRDDKAKITIRHLATHSSGFPAGDRDFYEAWRDRQPDEHPYAPYVRHALMRNLAYEPGTSHIYSDPAVCLLGEIIYRVSGQRIPELIEARVFQPLALQHIGWDFDAGLAEAIALCVQENWPQGGRFGTPEARREGSVWGGLIGNARDVVVQCQLRELRVDSGEKRRDCAWISRVRQTGPGHLTTFLSSLPPCFSGARPAKVSSTIYAGCWER